jgi:NAD(P)-dependent dehydrogenase (short-subunit alcohol dehydrogenase family)
MPIADVSNRGLTELLSLEGRVAVVTGGAVGIGYAIAARLAEAGADVIVGDIGDATGSAARLQDLHPGRRIIGTTLDVRDSGSIVACADLAVAELGRLDIWVNNAGIYPSVPVLDLTDDDWDRVLEVNLRGSFVGAREAARRMVAAGHGGVVINIASTAGYQAGGPGVAHYVSSKHGVRGLTKSLAVELGPAGIRVLAIAPTLIETPGIEAGREQFRRAGLGDVLDTYAQRLPLGRVGVSDDVARVAVFCASDLATFMTGSTLLADGGDVAV